MDATLIVVIWVASAVSAAAVAHVRGLKWAGWFGAGLLLGPFAVLFAAVSKP